MSETDNKRRLMLIGGRVKEARDDMGLTQEQFADKYGYARTTLAKLEAGIRDFKSTEIITLAEQLNVSCDYLLGRSRASAPDNFMQEVVTRYGLSEQDLQSLERLTAMARLYEEHQRLTDGTDRLERAYKEIRNDKSKDAQVLEIGIEQSKLQTERDVLEAEMIELTDPGEGYFKPPECKAPVVCRQAWQQLHAISALLTLEPGEQTLNEMGEYLYMGSIDGTFTDSNGNVPRAIRGEDYAKIKLFNVQEWLVKMRQALSPQ